VNYLLYLIGALVRSVFLPTPNVIMVWSDPPIIGLVAVCMKYLKGSKIIFVPQDVYPEVAIAAGKMNNIFFVVLLRFLTGSILRASDRIIAVGQCLQKRLYGKGCLADQVSYIPNWQDIKDLAPKSGAAMRSRHAISKDAFVVMHSGNIGYSQNFDLLLEVARLLKGQPRIQFVIAGDGSRMKELKAIKEKNHLSNVLFLPYQLSSELAESLSMADIHYVSLLPKFTGYIVPSKIYGILAVGRATIANVDPNSEVALTIEESKSGVLVPPDAEAMKSELLSLSNDPGKVRTLGNNGHTWIQKNRNRDLAVSAYKRTFHDVFENRFT
jgi:glycosyltransferase involved in cell wall biosynthesis